jgi:TatD family-associated radical SAM protein
LETAEYISSISDIPIRVNTNGMSDLINKKKTAPILAKVVEHISISLNAPDSDTYFELCRPKFGRQAFDALIQFALDCKKNIPKVTLSIVGHTINAEAQEKCRELCKSLGIPLRVR